MRATSGRLFAFSVLISLVGCGPTAGDPAHGNGGSTSRGGGSNGGSGQVTSGGFTGFSGGQTSGGSNSLGGSANGGSANGGSGGTSNAGHAGLNGNTGGRAGAPAQGGTTSGGGTGGSQSMGGGGGRVGMGGNGGRANGGTGGMSAGGNAMGGSTAGGSSGGSSTAGAPGGGDITQPSDTCAPRAGYRNLFHEVLGKTDAEVDAKLEAGFQQLFHGTSDQTVYYEGGGGAYILDVNNNDVRSEGMSYGMTISVQLDKKTEFNKIYDWARSHMKGSNGYFAWQANSSGQVIGGSSAPDGDEYFAMALVLASKRWGDSGGYNYGQDAKNLLGALKNNGDFHGSAVNFGPGTNYTDPSYMLPAFYEVWACFDTANQSFWKGAASAARQFFQKTCNSTTGLAPYLANFDASPYSGGGDFNSDSWRVVGNIMMDHHLFNTDSWQKQFASKYAAFFAVQQKKSPMPDEFQLNGTVKVTHEDPAKGLMAQNALVGFGVGTADATYFVQTLWDMAIPSGHYRYYDGMLYMLAFLHASGRFRLEW